MEEKRVCEEARGGFMYEGQRKQLGGLCSWVGAGAHWGPVQNRGCGSGHTPPARTQSPDVVAGSIPTH